jgi:DNA-binding NtrC family response regulator
MDTDARILIVDDDAGIRDSFARMFEKAGYETHAVADGETAEKVLSREFFPLVVFGLKHQGKNGLDRLRQLRIIHPHTKILAVTAYSDLLPREAVLLAGAFDYLRKPVRRAELLHSVQRAMESTAKANG